MSEKRAGTIRTIREALLDIGIQTRPRLVLNTFTPNTAVFYS
jgi:hypothetical protein